MGEIEAMRKQYDEAKKGWKRFLDKVEKLQRGDELPPGVMKMVKVFVAVKRKDPARRQDGRPPRQQGRGLAHRAEEDMPFLADGHAGRHRAEPLGVPSRMNVGQILETHLAGLRRLGKQVGEAVNAYRSRRTIASRCAPSRRHLRQGRDDRGLDERSVVELGENLRAASDRNARLRRRARKGHRDAGKAGLDPSGQVTLFDGARAKPSTARSRSATSTC